MTAFADYAIKAFEANALDYLLKPIDDRRLKKALARARQHLEERAAVDHRSRLLKLICDLTGEELTLDQALENDPRNAPHRPRRLAIKEGSRTACVDVADIDWIDAAGDYLCVHAAGQTHVLRGTMKRMEQILDPQRFVRIHRSTIVKAEPMNRLMRTSSSSRSWPIVHYFRAMPTALPSPFATNRLNPAADRGHAQ